VNILPYVTIEGVKYHYSASLPVDKEPRQAVVFVHGSGGSHAKWVNQVKYLGRDFLAIAVDLPGHGHSGGTPLNTIEGYREFIKVFSECVIGFPFFLAGHSMGGAVALDFALSYQERLAGLILVGTGSRLRVMPAVLEQYRNGLFPDSLPAFMYRQGTSEALLRAAREDMERIGPALYYSDLSACDKFDVSGRLGEIEIPALAVTGSQDRMTPVKYGQFLANNLKKGYYEEIENAGHMVMLEQPEKLNSVIFNFLMKYGR